MTQPFRLPSGGRIDRARVLRFSFDGRAFEGHPGDSLASALLANGVHLVGRSFKYHRPRGIVSAGSEEPNALVTIDRGAGRMTPNLRATQIELYDGLVATSQNRWPSLEFDIGAIGQFASRLIPAGFYYKTFLWPPRAWKHLYEPLIRRAAGLGKAPGEPDPDTYAHQFAHCDVLVVGGGPAGLQAALAAAAQAESVILCDEQPEPGGSALHDPARASELSDLLAKLRALSHVRILQRTTAFGMFAQNFVALAQRLSDHIEPSAASGPRERLWQVRAKRIVLATGAIERPLVFPGNDLPGVMLAEAARIYANRFCALPGKRIVIATSADSAYEAAGDLRRAGAEIVAIVDAREGRPIADDFNVIAGAIIDTKGRARIEGCTVQLADGSTLPVDCDVLLMSGGWTPNASLLSQARGALRFEPILQTFVPDVLPPGISCVGACAGDLRPQGDASRPIHPKAFVDFQNDVTSADIALAVREGFRSIEHIKRYTTNGMATDQGKTSNLNAMMIAAAERSVAPQDIGATTFRPPYTPVTFGTFAGASRGELFEPVRRLPSHQWAKAHGGVFEDAGQWKRVSCFARPAETMRDCVNREVLTVRKKVGVFDASSLGKIELAGPDAVDFLNRIYINDFSALAIGRCRYALMLHESGVVLDDGIVARLAEDRFHITTTSGGIGHVLQHMEDFLQTEYTDLRVWLTDVTEQWATFAIQGPLAGNIVQSLLPDAGLSQASLPHMSLRELVWNGSDLRLMRASFTGEAGFEINVPSVQGAALWDTLVDAAERLDGCAYGLEALNVLRAEKGYIIVGQETDGSVTADDLGYGKMVGARKGDFVGKRSLSLPHLAAKGRKQLVGLLPLQLAQTFEEGAQITQAPHPASGTHALGHVTTAFWSATLDRFIALALLEDGRARIGQTLHVPMPAGAIAVQVTSPVFFDPDGSRLRG